MARIFTGWGTFRASGDYSRSQFNDSGVDVVNPMGVYPDFHENREKRLVTGQAVPSGLGGEADLDVALDILFQHPNVGPFISRQLIQRLVTSNPSAAYVRRVAAVFANNGRGVRGDLGAVARAILLDPEARDPARLADTEFGKLREPVLRLTAWMRAFNASNSNNRLLIGRFIDPATSLGQQPFSAPSVFNFFRPDYRPPIGLIGEAGLDAPEFQTTNETSVTGYVNFMTNIVANGVGSDPNAVRADYGPELDLANQPAALVDRLSLVLTAGRMSAATRQIITEAIAAIPETQTNSARDRVRTAVLLTLASPEFLIQK
jgi:uncharacterized protein (DUF1800 family)